jgi:thiamine biosynthesis lipoprotein
MTTLGRRRFLTLTLGGGGALAAGAALGFYPWSRPGQHFRGTSSGTSGELLVTTRTSRALGSDVSITVLHGDRAVAETALDAAFAELELVEELMSIYRSHSQLSRLNRDGVLNDPHPYLLTVLRRSQDLAAETDGAFDVTVQPLWKLYNDAHKAGRLPQESELTAARAKVDWRRLKVTPQWLSLQGDGTAVTLNGIAQGFAADRVRTALQNHRIEHALVNTGEITALGNRTHDEPWKIGIQHPRQSDAFVSLARLADRSLATSGDYATSFSADHKHSHIFDPRTGRSPGEFASVSIVAPTAMEADALSTTVFVLGLERGMELLARLPGVDALFVQRDGRTMNTANFPLEA